MDKHSWTNSTIFGDQHTSDIVLRLKNSEGRPEFFQSHSFILKSKSNYFADRLSNPGHDACIEIQCTCLNYDDHVKLLKCLYLPEDSLLDSWDSVRSALGVLQVAAALHCESILNSCIQYLEAVPWEDNEEDEIVKVVPKLGPVAMHILARLQPVDVGASKSVFIAAVRFATSLDGPCPPFGDELRTSAQEQIDYMLGDDEEMPLVTADDEVKSETRNGLSKMFSLFERELSSFLESDAISEEAENRTVQSLCNLEWICNILPKMDLMYVFVNKWIDISDNVLKIIEDKKFECVMWGLKVKLIEVMSKVLEAVAYGNVIVPAPQRVRLLNSWLPFIRKLKPILDTMIGKDETFHHKMDEDLCQSIEVAMVALVLALPSDDQADILADWMNSDQLRYPDLSEAFEVWCFRTKSAKRRLVGGLDRVDNPTVSL